MAQTFSLSEIERRISRYADIKNGNAFADGTSPAAIAKERSDMRQALKLDGKVLCELVPCINAKEMQSTYCHVLADLIAVL